MKITIDKVLKNIPNNGDAASLQSLMIACDYPNMDMFKKDLLKYLKIKVKDFELSDDTLKINLYTSKDLDELFRYFGLRFTNSDDTQIKYINIKTLYECWNKNDIATRKEFEIELNKYIANVVGQENAFTFQGELSLKPYIEKTANNGVLLN